MSARTLSAIAAVAYLMSPMAVTGASPELCDVARRLDAAASSDFRAARAETIHSEPDFKIFRLDSAHLPPVVSRRSDCELQVYETQGASVIECRVVVGGADHPTTVRRSRQLAEALASCLSPAQQQLGNSIHRLVTRTSRWQVLVPVGQTTMLLDVRPHRPRP